MLKNQPSHVASASGTNRSGTESAKRSLHVVRGADPAMRTFAAEILLIRNWLDIIRRCARATAHGTAGGQLPMAEELLEILDAAEEAIATRIPGGEALLDALAGWEASLLHFEPDIDPRHCITCNRAAEVPEDLPAEYAWGLRVINDAA